MPSIQSLLIRFTLLSLVGLFLIPGVTYWFTGHAGASQTRQLRSALARDLASDTRLAVDERAALQDRFGTLTVAGLCGGAEPDLAALRAEVCATTAPVGQFQLARRVSGGLLLLGLATLVLIATLALLAYHVPRQQTRAFLAGWWSLRAISAAEIALQGVLVVWLSFWLTAFFFEIYAVKLILVAAALAGMGVYIAVRAILRRAPLDNAVSGELLDERQAPELWARIRHFAQRIGTAPPAHVVGGVDANFFVTETPLQVQDRVLQGRSLFVSLPLLRAMERDEADAVLAHELAHFQGGDTKEGAALGPRLNAYAHYMDALEGNLLTLLALFVLSLFRAAFELARMRESRAREFAADRAAAAMTSSHAVSRALVRIAGYSHYRGTVEQELFAQASRHQEALRLGERVATGLAAFAQSEQFRTSITGAQVPHPFDSHPPLVQRMDNVASVIAAGDFPGIVASTPAGSWIELIPQADEIEARLWQGYEAQFAAEHELSLAVRYEPANDAERAIVLKHFPDVEFPLKKDEVLRVSYRGIETAASSIPWDDVADIGYEDGAFGSVDVLTVTHPDRSRLGTRKTTKLKLAIASSERDRVKGTIGAYRQRHKVMRQVQAEMNAGPDAAPVAIDS
jgi:Zn-dependent protease with chaperone function